ncbi:MAG: hypothetical protein ACJAX5_001719 [Patiriisocius sp.]|jgi:hypothetical protein
MKKYKGSCQCGDVTYEYEGELGALGHCHCRICQKTHGAAYATYANAAPEGFQFLSGQSGIKEFRSTESVVRTFCGACGSNLQFIRKGKNRFGLAVASLDTQLDHRPEYEIWTAELAPWGCRDDIAVSHQEGRGAHHKTLEP